MWLPNAGAMDKAGEGKEKEECTSTSENSCEDWHLDQERALHARVRVPGPTLGGPRMAPLPCWGAGQLQLPSYGLHAGSRRPGF